MRSGNKFGAGIGLFAAVLSATSALAEDVDLSRFGPLPPVDSVVPKDNPMTKAKIELGKLLYFDTRLAGDSSKSCASCHDPKTGWTNRNQLSDGYPGTKHWRSVPSVLNSAFTRNHFWDGRAGTLEEQAPGPIQAPIEMNQSPDHLVEKLAQIPVYQKKFKEIFDSEVTFENVAKAIAAFERTVVSRNVPFDEYLRGDKSALDAEQVAGLKLFAGKAGCVQCHHGPLLTDDGFHVTGVPEIEPLQKESDRIATRHFFAKGQGYKHPELGHRIDTDYGRELITKKPEDRGKFKTPTLREVAVTPPYMHNGAFVTLEEVVEFYNQGGGKHPNKDSRLRPLNLTDEEKQALIAFLESLSGDDVIVEAPELPKKADGAF
ncbi:MAG: methylamine utilization protein [Phycisphaerae bacterium]